MKFDIGDTVVIIEERFLPIVGQTAVIIDVMDDGRVRVNNNAMESFFRNSSGLAFRTDELLPVREHRVRKLLNKLNV